MPGDSSYRSATGGEKYDMRKGAVRYRQGMRLNPWIVFGGEGGRKAPV